MTEFWEDRSVFVTGATGLLGSTLTRRLLKVGAKVTCLIRDAVPRSCFYSFGLDREVTTVHGDVECYTLLERALNEYEVDTVFHLAAQTIVGTANRSPLSTFEANIRGTWSMLEATRVSRLVGAVVIASSDKAYGAQQTLPYTEEAPLAATLPYDVSKACAEFLARSYFETYGLPVTVTRCGNLFGPGDLNFSRLIPGTIRSVIRGERPVIRSDGLYLRDYFYVEDAAEAYLLLAERTHASSGVRGQPFNFSSEQPVTVIEMTKRILDLMGSPLTPDVRNEAQNEIRDQYLSATKARELLGWNPLFSTDEALKHTIEWYQGYFRGQVAS